MIKLNNEKKLNNIIFKGFLPIAIYFLVSLYGGIIPQLFKVDLKELSLNIRIIYASLLDIIIVCSLLIIFYEVLKINIKDFKKNNQKYFSKYVKYWLIGVGVMFTSNIIITLITNNTSSNNQEAIMEIFKVAPIYMFISAVIIAPLTEELVFRKSIQNIFENKIIFILVSGLVFGALHVIPTYTQIADLLYIIPYSALGIAFAYILSKTNNIIVPMSFHFIHNGIAMTLAILLSQLS